MSWKKAPRLLLRGLTRRWGYDLVEYPSREFQRRIKLMQHFGVDLVLDVGADTGEYVQKLRRYGYRGRVVSFEPLSASFTVLSANAARDPRWDVVNTACGARDGEAELNVAGNLHSSSLLEMLPAHESAAPESAYVRRERVRLRRLDSIFEACRGDARHVFLKIDTQGYEQTVLEGAAQSLKSIVGVQLEMSLVPLYRGQVLFPELLSFMSAQGYTLMLLEPGFGDDRTGQLLQVDGIFFRADGDGAARATRTDVVCRGA